ncbi:hypothetical protein [Amycolatopsis nigrescens]|uniref:hypothetical protein n=1 Tax=Amycolatopsis nigrescens TaxID=381445 RepID=UPI0004777141|nr:hypothetical protein [Amycolatopsis nigrescens]
MVNQPRDPKTGRWIKSGTGVAAVITGGVVAFSGTGTGTVSIESGTGSGIAKGKTSGKDAARKGQRDTAWQRMGLKIIKKTAKQELLCSSRSFGEVQQFFVRTPCRKLDRTLLAIGDGHGNTIAVSIAWVRMRSVGEATRLKELADTHGTGNISPLGTAALDLTGIHFTGYHYDSRRDGSLVVIAETAPAGGRPDDQALDDVADVADEFPAP